MLQTLITDSAGLPGPRDFRRYRGLREAPNNLVVHDIKDGDVRVGQGHEDGLLFQVHDHRIDGVIDNRVQDEEPAVLAEAPLRYGRIPKAAEVYVEKEDDRLTK